MSQRSEAPHKPSAWNNGFPYKHLRTIGHGHYPVKSEKRTWKIIFDIACIILYLEEMISEDFMNHECKTVWKYGMMYCIDTQAAR